jgi:hypothetical protein
MGASEHMAANALRMILSWLLVLVLLGYGVYQTGVTAAKLF